MKKNLLLVLFILIFSVLLSAQESAMDYFLLDDFSDYTTEVGTEWEGFTDRVMGGRSDMQAGLMNENDEMFLRLSGRVTLENNGGFIQTRMRLDPKKRYFDASAYSGVRVKVRGNGKGYYIFLRNANTVFPWKYYAAPIPLSEDWQIIDIPWSAFEKGKFGNMPPLKTNKIRSFALTAAFVETDSARIDLAEIGLY